LNCGSFVTNSQLGYVQNSYQNATLAGGSVGFPCGTSGRMYNKFRPELKSFQVKYPNGSVGTCEQVRDRVVVGHR
jgi:hypothetical protein